MCDIKKISLRPVVKSDMDFIIELLQSISEFKPLKSDHLQIWNDISDQTNIHALVAVVDNQILGYGSIIIETKIRGGKVGHLEDIVSHSSHRNKRIGMTVIDGLLKIAKANDCYKVILQCKEHNLKFYNKFDFALSGLAMQKFF